MLMISLPQCSRRHRRLGGPCVTRHLARESPVPLMKRKAYLPYPSRPTMSYEREAPSERTIRQQHGPPPWAYAAPTKWSITGQNSLDRGLSLSGKFEPTQDLTYGEENLAGSISQTG